MAKPKEFQGKVKRIYKYCADKISVITIKQHIEKLVPSWGKAVFKSTYKIWKAAIFSLFCFLFFYYFLGSQIAENIDVQTQYLLPKQQSAKMETANAMNFLLKREVDDKMWTPNLPPLFPAYVLDNMPNFQIGIVDAVQDINDILRRMEGINAEQYDDLQKAGQLLNYAPNIWLLSKKDTFNIAPSSNTQYRKAAKYLRKFNERADFSPHANHLPRFMEQISRKLTKLVFKSEEHQQEHGGDIIDFRVDNIFYHNCGYAFALSQICKAMGADYKEEILRHNVYTEWTYLLSSLQKAAEFQPVVVRSGKPKDLLTPNHLTEQNFYLMRALVAVEKIRTALAKGATVDAN